jgi:hypothetical protein
VRDTPVHVPVLALNVLPTVPVPVITGSAVFCGDCLPGGEPAAPAAPAEEASRTRLSKSV